MSEERRREMNEERRGEGRRRETRKRKRLTSRVRASLTMSLPSALYSSAFFLINRTSSSKPDQPSYLLWETLLRIWLSEMGRAITRKYSA